MVLTCQQLSYTQITCMLLKTMSFGEHLSDFKNISLPSLRKGNTKILKYSLGSRINLFTSKYGLPIFFCKKGCALSEVTSEFSHKSGYGLFYTKMLIYNDNIPKFRQQFDLEENTLDFWDVHIHNQVLTI